MVDDRHGEDLAVIHPEDWPTLRDQLEDFLDVAELDGPDAECAWLDAPTASDGQSLGRRRAPTGESDDGLTGGAVPTGSRRRRTASSRSSSGRRCRRSQS